MCCFRVAEVLPSYFVWLLRIILNYFANLAAGEFLSSSSFFFQFVFLDDTSLRKLMTISRKNVRQINRRKLAIVTMKFLLEQKKNPIQTCGKYYFRFSDSSRLNLKLAIVRFYTFDFE